ncbi:MAG: YdeI/OmpD-associated family protein [Bacteroidota bacterium]|nr:YdeI/OmpD-associated family protein [Bacteroidota bacterium]
MVQFTATIKRFAQQGEKTGWTYFEVPPDLAQELKPGNRKEFKVKGKLDTYPVKRVSLLPMGGGRFIFVLNAALRKAIGKKQGATVKVQLTEDKSEFIFSKDFMDCLEDEPRAQVFFQTLTGSHQRYFSKWIDDAKTERTKVNRITMAVNALAKKCGYPEMLRANKKEQP